MRLCGRCESSRDWVGTAPTAKEVRLREQGMICQGCGRFKTGHPLFRLCEPCSGKEGQERCQHCLTYLTPEAEAKAAADEAREDLIDLFTHCVKVYGLSTSRDLFAAMRDALGPAADEVARLDHRDIDGTGGREQDRERLKRPIWTKVLGSNIFRFRFCADCSAMPRRAPAIIKAERCGHWTTLRSPAYCPTCAADANACETCGASIE